MDALRDLGAAFGKVAGHFEVVQCPDELEDRMPPNQITLRIPLRQRDDRAIRELYRRLSARTRYLRFSLPMPEPPDSLLRLITSLDDRRRLALLAESDTVEGGEVVALSEFAAIDDHTAEVALVVRDEWQRQGLGTALATRTLLAAEARGFDLFVAQMLYENVGVMRLLDRVGVVVSMKIQRGISEVTFIRRRRSQ